LSLTSLFFPAYNYHSAPYKSIKMGSGQPISFIINNLPSKQTMTGFPSDHSYRSKKAQSISFCFLSEAPFEGYYLNNTGKLSFVLFILSNFFLSDINLLIIN